MEATFVLAVKNLAVEFPIWKNHRTVGASGVSLAWRTICMGQFVMGGNNDQLKLFPVGQSS